MNKEQILKNIEDEVQRKNVETILNYAESVAKTGEMTAEQFAEKFATEAEKMQIEVDKVDGLQAQLDKMGAEIDAMKEKAPDVKISIADQIKEGLKANADKLELLKTEKTSFNFVVKTVGTMTTAASITGQIPAAQRIPGLNEIALREPMLIEMLPSSSTTSNRVEWAYEVAGEGGAGGTLEGNEKNQIDADFAVGYENIIKRTVYVKITEEMLNDVDFMASYINNQLLGMRLRLDIEDQVLNGTTSTTSLHGIIEQSTAWAAGDFANTVVEPNELDAVMVGANMINVAHHSANLIIMHPSDITALALKKDLNGNYIFPNFQLPSGKVIAGMPVMTSTVIASRKFVVCDRTKATVYNREGIRIEAGYDGNDFIKNLRTIRAEARLALVIETNDRTAFVYGDFDTAYAALKQATS